MHNSNPRRIRGSTPARDPRSFWTWRGYCDGAAGVGFCAEYDTLGAGNQRNYERGRQIAITLKAERGKAPTWRKSERLTTMLQRVGGWYLMVAINETMSFFFQRREVA